MIKLLLITATVMLGYRLKLLTFSGSIAAFLVGFLVVVGFGMKGLILLGIFFASSSLWSKVKNKNKRQADDLVVKGARRDSHQVFANGGLAALASTFYYFSGDNVWIIVFSICIAAANSDTWASEIGSMSKGKPYFIKNLKKVERGTSGAVSMLGTFSSIGGALLIAVISCYLFKLTFFDFYLILILGFLGNVIDTLIGAFIQAGYRCSKCGILTEKRLHCGYETKLMKGYSLLNNDTVNFISGLIPFLLGLLIMT
jgi:uncharacterized protein (TIGR00297 family)